MSNLSDLPSAAAIQGMTAPQLVETYNEFSDAKVKRFADRKAAVSRVTKAVEAKRIKLAGKVPVFKEAEGAPVGSMAARTKSAVSSKPAKTPRARPSPRPGGPRYPASATTSSAPAGPTPRCGPSSSLSSGWMTGSGTIPNSIGSI
jgi:hypothetical protein